MEERAGNEAESIYFLGMRLMNTEDSFRYQYIKGRFKFSFKNFADCFALSKALKKEFGFKLYGPTDMRDMYKKGWDRLGYERGLSKARFEDFF